MLKSELTFRILLFLVFFIFVIHRGYYTRKYSSRKSEIIEKKNPDFLSRLADVLAVPAFLATLLYLAYPQWMSWAALAIPIWMRWFGLAPAVGGFVLLQSAHNAIGGNWSDTPRFTLTQTLTTSGPYRLIRNPIYTAFLLILISPVFISANWFIGILWPLMTLLDIISRIRFEEKMLIMRFGNTYREYLKKSGRLFPRILPRSK